MSLLDENKQWKGSRVKIYNVPNGWAVDFIYFVDTEGPCDSTRIEKNALFNTFVEALQWVNGVNKGV